MNFHRSLAPLLAVLLAGCHHYAPADLATLAPQEHVRVMLGQAELSNFLAYADARSGSVAGRFVSETADSVTMVVQTPLAYSQVSFPRSSVIQVQRRKVDNRRSFIFSAAAVGFVGVLAYRGFSGEANPFVGGDSEGGDSALIPLFSLGLPFGIGH